MSFTHKLREQGTKFILKENHIAEQAILSTPIRNSLSLFLLETEIHVLNSAQKTRATDLPSQIAVEPAKVQEDVESHRTYIQEKPKYDRSTYPMAEPLDLPLCISHVLRGTVDCFCGSKSTSTSGAAGVRDEDMKGRMRCTKTVQERTTHMTYCKHSCPV
jgi:hypothetical protein